MDYEFLVRTADNVEIILDVSIFWQITDLYKLVLVTQDPPEDICKLYYCLFRSSFFQSIYFESLFIKSKTHYFEKEVRFRVYELMNLM